MKRLVVGIGTLILVIQIAGCDSGSSSPGPATGPAVKNSENPNLPAEVREFEAQQEARIAKAMEKGKQKQQQKNPRQP
jgi:hypothetical protein